MKNEKRKHPREQVEFLLKYRVCGSESHFKYAYYKNISLGGVLIIELDQKLLPGALVEIELSMPSLTSSSFANALLILGKIVYCKRCRKKPRIFDCGIEFVEMDEEKKNILEQFLKYVEKGI